VGTDCRHPAADIETKTAILKKKAETEAVPLPDNVAMYIASRIKSNIRELEGSLIRLLAYASLTGRPLTIELAQDVLRNVLDHDERAVTIEQIQKFVADYYQLKLVDLKSRNNSKSVAMPRQVAMYLCKMLTHASLPEIGRSFGGKHHSTVIHSIKKVEELRKTSTEFNSLVTTSSSRSSRSTGSSVDACGRPVHGAKAPCGGRAAGRTCHSLPQKNPQP
jgi:chromosomal replication initiator protein